MSFLKLGGGVQKKRGGGGRGGRPVAAAFLRTKDQEDEELAAELQAHKIAVDRLKDEGNELAELGDLRSALGKWESAAALDPTNAVLQELRAQAFLGLEEWWPAVQAAERATNLGPEFGEGWVTLGRAQLNLGEFGMGEQCFIGRPATLFCLYAEF
jgi:tetratricopeptide (TPR) repeat protein